MEITIDTRSINTMALTYAGGPQIVRDETMRGMTRAVLAIEADAKRLAPVDRGQLRRSLTHEVTASAGGVVGRAGTNLNYGEVVEKGRGAGKKYPPPGALLGWMSRKGIDAGEQTDVGGYFEIELAIARKIGKKGIKAKPYLKPAFDKNRPAITRELGAVLLRRVSDRLAAGR